MLDRSLLRRVAAAIAWLAGLGCAPRLSPGAPCARASDCPEPLVCAFDRRCREACTTSRDCALGLICVRDPSAPEPTSAARVCSLELEGCRAATCPEGLVCVEEACVNRCTLASDCPDGVCRADQTCAPLRAPLDADLDATDPTDARSADVAAPVDAETTDAASTDVPATDGGSPDAPASRELGEALLTPPGSLAGAASVAINADGSVVVLGTPRADAFDRMMGPLASAGGAHVFARVGTTWTLEATLVASDRAAMDAFGTSVAISADGSTALVGAPFSDRPGRLERGSAYVFARTATAGGMTWTEEAVLLRPVAASAAFFGRSVALSTDGTLGVIGAPGAGAGGEAIVFARTGTTWAAEATLVGTGTTTSDQFGFSLAMAAAGDRVIVGAPANSADPGAAFVYVRGTPWIEEARLAPAALVPDVFFGASVALDAAGATALVGVPRASVSGTLRAGMAETFVRTGGTWTRDGPAAVSPSGPDAAGSGVALSASGSLALVGAPARDSAAAPEVGAAVTFVRSGTPWTLGDTLLEPADRGAAADHFGSSAALSGDGTRAVVGGMLTLNPADVAGARVFLLR